MNHSKDEDIKKGGPCLAPFFSASCLQRVTSCHILFLLYLNFFLSKEKYNEESFSKGICLTTEKNFSTFYISVAYNKEK